MVSHGLNPLITRPTRVHDHGFSLIDHIWCSEKDLCVESGVAICDVTDHYPVFSVFKSSNNFEKDPYFSYHVRLKSEECRVKFRETFGNIYHNDFENVDLQSSYERFAAALTLAYNVAYPMVEKRKKKLDLTKPYIDRELKILIKKKHALQKKIPEISLYFWK